MKINFKLGNFLHIYGSKKTAHCNRMLAIDLYAFGYRVRWYPALLNEVHHFGIREWA